VKRSRLSCGALAGVYVCVFLLAACSSPQSSFYTLGPDASLERTGPALPVTVVVGPVTVPDLVDRPQLVTRLSDNQVALNEFARWGAPLKSGVAEAIASDLARLLGSDHVSVSAQSVAGTDAYRVRVDIVQFDSRPGDAAVAIDALWTVRVAGRTALLTGRSTVREPVSGAGDPVVVAAYSRALAAVSRDIATAIRRAPAS
jgi:uncharacterized lipoprotein YmbA